MVGSDIKDINFNESGLSILIKAVNNRLYPLDLSRGVIGDTITLNGIKMTKVTVDKYPLLPDTHPAVIKNGRYYSFYADTTHLGDGTVDPEPQGVIKVVAIPYQADVTNWRFTVDGVVSPEFPNLTDVNGAGALMTWAQESERMMILNVIPISGTEGYYFILIANLKPGTLRDLKIENLTDHNFDFPEAYTSQVTDLVMQILQYEAPNVLPNQVHTFESGEFQTPEEFELTYFQATNGGTPVPTDRLAIRTITNPTPTVMPTDIVLRIYSNPTEFVDLSGASNTEADLLAAGLEFKGESDPNNSSIITYRVYNRTDSAKVIGWKVVPINQDLMRYIEAVENNTVEFDPVDGFWKGTVLPKSVVEPVVCPAVVSQFSWFDINNYQNVHLWYNDVDMGNIAQYLEGMTYPHQFFMEFTEGYGGTITNSLFECAKIAFIDPTQAWNPSNDADFESYFNDEDVALVYLANGIEFYLAGKEPEPLVTNYIMMDSEGWSVTRLIGGSTYTVGASTSGDWIADVGKDPLSITIEGVTTILTSNESGPISTNTEVSVTVPTNTDPSLHSTLYRPTVTLNDPAAIVEENDFILMTQLLTSNIVPTIGYNGVAPYGFFDKLVGESRWWTMDRTTVQAVGGDELSITMNPTYAGLQLYVNEDSVVGDLLLMGIFDENGVVTFTAPVIATTVLDKVKTFYVRDPGAPGSYIAAWNITFHPAEATLTYENGDPFTGWVGQVGQPFPDLYFTLPGGELLNSSVTPILNSVTNDPAIPSGASPFTNGLAAELVEPAKWKITGITPSATTNDVDVPVVMVFNTNGHSSNFRPVTYRAPSTYTLRVNPA